VFGSRERRGAGGESKGKENVAELVEPAGGRDTGVI